jgi:hypothetical protein
MAEKLVLFTFDYELFLGKKSGSVEKCLIKPTDHLLQILNRFNRKGIFFVDTSYLIRLYEIAEIHERAKTDLGKIINQLKVIIETGHLLFPHIHPHWLDAKYNEKENEWDLSDFTKYRFTNINDKQKEYLFAKSIYILKSIINPVYPEYKMDSYRAGGWSIQPFADFKHYFDINNITNDFSVIPGKYQLSNAQFFDFRNAPVKDVYNFDTDITIENKVGAYKEFTISSIFLSDILVWLNFKISGLLKRFKIAPYGKGSTVDNIITEESDYNRKRGKRVVASIEGMTLVTFFKYYKAILKNNYFQFISHPKLVTRHELFLFKYLLFLLRKKNIETDFNNISTRNP